MAAWFETFFDKHYALVLPKTHLPTIWDLPAGLGGDLFTALQAVGRGVMGATEAEGLNVGMNNHAAAGQVVPHAHFHLIPRHRGDGLSLWAQSSYADQAEMAALTQAILAKI